LKNISRLLAVLTLGFVFSMFASANTIWDVDAIFGTGSDANTVTGSFTTDSSFDIVNYDIVVSGTNSWADTTYTDADSNVFLSPSHDTIIFYETIIGPGVELQLQSALPSGSGSPIDVESGFACGFLGGCTTTLKSGALTDAPSAVPEPSTVILCIPAILVLAFFGRRKAVAHRAVS
jgi:hypothetical protein